MNMSTMSPITGSRPFTIGIADVLGLDEVNAEPTWRMASRGRLGGIHCLIVGRTLRAAKMSFVDYLRQGCRHRDIVGISRANQSSTAKKSL